ncbi:GTPase-activator protein, partial [Oesophagostomum dentatum]
VDLGNVARPIVQAMASTCELRPLLNALYAADIERCQDLNTLFRSHTLASKMLYELLKIYGHSYLLISLKPVIDKVYKERRCCEIDPSRLPQGESLEKNMTMLLSYFALVFARVVESAPRCPPPIKTVLSDLRMVVREKTGRADVELLALSSFLIMRFFAAAVLSPKSFGIKHEQPEPRVARTLVLLSKMLQRVANCCVSLHPLTTKEPWLSAILEKVADDEHRQAMSSFLDRVSLQTNDPVMQAKSTAILKE